MYKYFLASIFLGLTTFSCVNRNAGSSNTDSMNDSVREETISDASSMYLLVGTYTLGESKGIYVYQFDTVSGYSKYRSMAEIANPSYLALSKDEKFVYAVSETRDNTASANAFSFNKEEGSLKLLNSQLTGGADPCYIAVNNSGKQVVTGNYTGGNLTLFNTNADGSLAPASNVINFTGKGVDSDRQKQPHIHYVNFTPDGKHLLAVDLGTDKIYKFDVNDNEGDFLKIGTPPSFKLIHGSGPRHLDFHPNGKYMYLLNELAGTINVFDYGDGNLTQIQTVKADTLEARGSADIHVSPDGRFLYASNRLKGDGIAIFSISEPDGKLTKAGYQQTGTHPRNFVITPNGKYLLVANRDSDLIQIFEIDKKTGLLTDTYKKIELEMPVCLKFASFK